MRYAHSTKLSVILAISLFVTGCASSLSTYLPSFAKYKITDEQAIMVMGATIFTAKCIWGAKFVPTTAQLNKLSEADRLIFDNIYYGKMEAVMGKQMYHLAAQDLQSQQYNASKLHDTFEKQKPALIQAALSTTSQQAAEYNKTSLCIRKKKEYNEVIPVAKKLIKQRKAEQVAKEAYYRTPQGQAQLAQQQMLAQQQAFQSKMLKQQRDAQWQASINSQIQQMNANTQQLLQQTRNMSSPNANWGFPNSSIATSTCQKIGGQFVCRTRY